MVREMSESFDRAVGHLLIMEGEYSDNPDDNGGETRWGMSKRAFPALDIKNLTRDQAIEIYKQHYWTPIHGDELPPAVSFMAFDMAVNHGAVRAIKMLQQMLNLAADGVVGAQTIAAAKGSGDALLLQRLTALRIKSVRKHPDADVFFSGWVNRYLTVFRESLCLQN